MSGHITFVVVDKVRLTSVMTGDDVEEFFLEEAADDRVSCLLRGLSFRLSAILCECVKHVLHQHYTCTT